ncbi:MAG TPA: T9SS type A sorting domain-containing protein [Ignavibacteriaceae bacterium]|nr:T9SS type A sorting domain-containing protein [Ignavibacteriaceae bacterium]
MGWGSTCKSSTSFVLNPSNPNYQTAIATFEGEQFFTNTNFSGYDWPHFRIIRPDDININAFGYGLYKFSVDGGSAYFFIDYRDDSYGRNIYSNCPGNDCNDIWIKYESDPVDKLYYVRHDPDSEPGIDPEHSAWISISNGQLLYYYKIKLQQSPSTDEFPDFWENCLTPLPNGGGHPMIYWGRHPLDDVEFEVDNYKIYRAVSSGLPPPNPNYISIATVGSDIFSFTDYDFASGGPLNLQYRVTAVYEDLVESVYETSPTNSVLISGSLYKDHSKVDEKIEFYLSDNYPNPFNPSTTIDYAIKSTGFVTLKVYDLLGTEVASLVNERKEPGNYTVTFDASNLQSGIYFYTLASGNFTETKKLILLK